jgi:hypothetical protein
MDQFIREPFTDPPHAETAARLEKQMDAFRSDLHSHPYAGKLERRRERAERDRKPFPVSMKLVLSAVSALVIAVLLFFGALSPDPAFAFEDVVGQFMRFRPYRCHISTWRDGARIGIREVYYGDAYHRRDESINVISGRKVISVHDTLSVPWKTLHIVGQGSGFGSAPYHPAVANEPGGGAGARNH